MGRMGIIAELMEFLRVRRKLWLAPVVLFLLFVGVLLIFSQSSAITPFIYALF